MPENENGSVGVESHQKRRERREAGHAAELVRAAA